MRIAYPHTPIPMYKLITYRWHVILSTIPANVFTYYKSNKKVLIFLLKILIIITKYNFTNRLSAYFEHKYYSNVWINLFYSAWLFYSTLMWNYMSIEEYLRTKSGIKLPWKLTPSDVPKLAVVLCLHDCSNIRAEYKFR